MRQDHSVPAQVESLLCDKPVSLWRLISENETKCSNFEQNRSTKSQKAAEVRIVEPETAFELEKNRYENVSHSVNSLSAIKTATLIVSDLLEISLISPICELANSKNIESKMS